MRILYLINFAGKAGTEKYVENLARRFTAAGNECHLAYCVAGELSERLSALGMPCVQLDLGWKNALSSAKRLAEYCREQGIEVIHAQYPRENLIALLSLRHYAAPRVVYTSHLTIRQGAHWRPINRVFTPKNHRIIAVCREGGELLRENGFCAERIEVIYNGVEPMSGAVRCLDARRELGVGDNEIMLSILARYAPEKGLDFLLDALKELDGLTKLPWRCVICGDGEGYEAFTKRSAELGLSGRVIQAGFRRDSGRILAASDIYLNTSGSREAMSFAVLEAMNYGLPLVVTDVGGNRDLAETNTVCGFVLPYGDTRGFAAAIARLMEDDALRREYSDAARRKVREEFDLDKLAQDVFRAYQ